MDFSTFFQWFFEPRSTEVCLFGPGYWARRASQG